MTSPGKSFTSSLNTGIQIQIFTVLNGMNDEWWLFSMVYGIWYVYSIYI